MSELSASKEEVRQNAMQRGQTFPELLEAEGKSEEQFDKDTILPRAMQQVKISLVLSEIAEMEQIDVSTDEVMGRIQALKLQYKDSTMQAELDKPENRRTIASQIVTEKTLEKLMGYVTGK